MMRGLCPNNSLTSREEEVIRLLQEGLNNKDLAKRLGVGVETAKRHLQNIFDKTGMSTRLEVCVWSLQNPDMRHHLWMEQQLQILLSRPNEADMICGQSFIDSMKSSQNDVRHG